MGSFEKVVEAGQSLSKGLKSRSTTIVPFESGPVDFWIYESKTPDVEWTDGLFFWLPYSYFPLDFYCSSLAMHIAHLCKNHACIHACIRKVVQSTITIHCVYFRRP